MTPFVSVVVPTRGRRDLLIRCLDALAGQDLPPAAFEVLVADDEASAETERLVCRRAQTSPMTMRYLAVRATQGPAGARNAGWRAAQGELIAFTDDDCLPTPNWLLTGVEQIQAQGAEAGWGSLILPLPERPTDYQRDAANLARAGFVTANCFCRRQALEAVGGFDERFTAAWREDSDLQFTLEERGCRVMHLPEAVVVHPIRPAPWGVSLRQQRKAMFNALLYKKHPRRYRQQIGTPPRRYYPIAGALVAALVGAAVGWWTLALAALAVWLALTAAFCVRRLRGTTLAPAHIAEMAVTSAIIPFLSLYWNLRGAWKYRVPFV